MLLNSILIFFICIFISLFLLLIFFFLSKSENWENYIMTSFECGFSSYFYSRYSFSIHYFLIGMIFLFLDLELCILMPFINMFFSNFYLINTMIFFVSFLLWGLLKEWEEGKIQWLK